MQTQAIQAALQQAGYDLGPTGADGVWGRASIEALKQFQAHNQIGVTGVIDAESLKVLFGQRTAEAAIDPVWYVEATRLKGIHEVEGPGNNPVILGWAQSLSAWVAKVYKADATPWCGLFVGHCIAVTLPREVLPANPLGALNWATFGAKLLTPSLGTICVFKRTGGGHVAFYAGEDESSIHTLGGNQSDQVDITRVPKDRLVAFRWPTTAPRPTTGRIVSAATGALSRNEA